jgi:transposase-like protein
MNKIIQPKQKAAIALAALKGEKISTLSGQYQIHPTQIGRWAEQLASEAETIFADKRKKDNYSKDRIIDELYKTIGQREVEISWLKKKFKLELPREIDIGE